MTTTLLAPLLVIIESPFTLFVPGFFLVRRLSLSSWEKAAASLGASIAFLYLYSFLVFVCGLPMLFHGVYTAGGVVLAWRCREDLRKFFSSPEVKQLGRSYAVLIIAVFMLLECVRNYSGGDWWGDWYEHYQRAWFFVQHLPLHTSFLGLSQLPERTPLFNLVAGHFLAEWGAGYAVYQVAATLLNLTVFFPAALFFEKLAPRAVHGPLTLAVVMALNPSLVENATYGWTKLLTVFYVLLGVWFYCRFLERQAALSLHLAFASLSLAVLTHYSAAPYVAVLVAHYLWTSFPRFRWKQIAGLAVANALILFTWFAWSMAHYGARATYGSNISVKLDTQHSAAENIEAITSNLFDTVVPPFLRADDPAAHVPFSMPALHDYSFLVYECNLLLAVGSLGWLFALWYAWHRAARVTDRKWLWFWLWFVVGGLLVGNLAMSERHPWGMAHLDLQPLTVLGLVMVAAAWTTLSLPLRWLMSVGLAGDLVLGVLLHFAYEHWYAAVFTAGDANWKLKHTNHLVFLGDVWPSWLFVAEALLLGWVFYRIYAERYGAGKRRATAVAG